MYLCLEGLDGSGKTTLFNKLKQRFSEYGCSVTEVCPTRISRPESYLEYLYSRHESLRQSSLFRALLYAARSHQTAKDAEWNSFVVLGDRSIVTSYVTRWRRWFNCRSLTVLFVNLFEHTIPAPDVVLYLSLPVSVLRARLLQRGKPTDIDETEARSEQMRSAYHEIMTGNPIKRLKNTKWIVIELDENDAPDAVLEKAWACIQNLPSFQVVS